MLLDAETGAVVKVIDPASNFKFYCISQSYMRSAGEIVSVVYTSNGDNHPDKDEVCMICFNQAEDTITTICNYGK